jgi:hypothetical protein
MEELDVRTLYVLIGLVVGCLYGVFVQSTAFCVRRGISDLAEGKGGATLTGWLGALLSCSPNDPVDDLGWAFGFKSNRLLS